MTLNKPSNSPSDESTNGSSRTLIIVMSVIILLAVGYTVVRTIAVPRASGGQTTQPTKQPALQTAAQSFCASKKA